MYVHTKPTLHKISLNHDSALASHHYGLMKNLRSKLGGRGPGLGMTWWMIWSLIRLMAMRMLAIVTGRDV